MMKIKTNQIRNLLLVSVVLIGIIFCAAFTTLAQTEFKVGDRVKASPLSMEAEKYWRNCIVTAVVRNGYSLKCDPQNKGGSAENFVVNAKWVRGSDKQDTKQSTEETNQSSENNDSQPNRETNGKNEQQAVACPESDPDTKGKNALEESFRTAIRQIWEKEPEPGLDGRVTVSFQSFSIGEPHKYRIYEDPKEAVGKMIYPARVIFTTCTDYRKRIVRVKRERAFSCYKDATGKSVCTIIAAANTNVKDKSESINKP